MTESGGAGAGSGRGAAPAFRSIEQRLICKDGHARGERLDLIAHSESWYPRYHSLDTARFNLGLVHEEQGRSEEAIASYRAELETNAKAYRAAFSLAKLLRGG